MEKPYLSVSALTKYLKRKFDADPYLQTVYVTGEVSNFNPRAKKHFYFSLKDAHAKIDIFLNQKIAQSLPFQLQEGMKVLAIGYVSIYEPSGQYRLSIEKIEPDGIGALYQAYEQLKSRLEKEGLFNKPKKPLPLFPQKIAIVTSESGAVIQDIKTTVARRFPSVQLVLFPTIVQGKQSVSSILKNLERIEADGSFDVVIIGRGGGSIEDLWSFNDEQVVYMVDRMKTPVISSVGHETDTTLIDFVADRRAATPTAAAELATPVLAQLHQEMNEWSSRLCHSIDRLLHLKKREVATLSQNPVLKQPQRLYENYAFKHDRLHEKLEYAIKQIHQKNEEKRMHQFHALYRLHPKHRMDHLRKDVYYAQDSMIKALQAYMNRTHYRLDGVMDQLDLLSPIKSMKRGYSVVHNEKGTITSIQQVESGDAVVVEVVDGQIKAVVTDRYHANKEV